MANNDEVDETDEGGPGRSIGLADAVVAIALTLLALDLKPDLPQSASSHDLAHYLREHAGQYIAFILAFFLISQYWLVHHHLMRTVRRTTESLLRMTLVFLFGITLIPLTTYLDGNLDNDLARVLFAANIALISVALGTTGLIIHRHRLDERPETERERVRRVTRSVTIVLIPVLVAVLVWPLGGQAAWFYVLFAVADRPGQLMTRRRAGP